MAEESPGAGPAGSAPPRPVRWRDEVAAAAVCVAVGLVMAALPNALWWPRIGEPVWVADNDDVFYLQLAARSYFHHPTRLCDPAVTEPGGIAYSTLTVAPGVVAARLLNAGPMAVGLIWRLLSGVVMGLSVYLLLRQAVGRPYLAMALACLLLADCGVLTCHLLVKPWATAARVVTGRAGNLLAGGPWVFPLWRAVNPGLSLPFLVAHVWLVLRARERPTPARVGLAGLSFGLLFYVYFYFFTAASLALALALAADAGHRRAYFHTLWSGGLIGLPAVVASYRFSKSTPADWLHRTGKFIAIPRFGELLIPTAAVALLAVGLAWVLLRRRDLMYLGLLGLAGLGLTNHQVVTRLQLENFHWGYVWGLTGSCLAVVMAADQLCPLARGRRWVVAVLAAGCAVQVALGVWLHGVEATRAREAVALTRDYARYRDDRRAAGGGPLAPNAVTGGDPRFVRFAGIIDDQRPLADYSLLISPHTDNATWNARVALNAYLTGQTFDGFRADQRRDVDSVTQVGPEARDPALREAMFASRLAAFREVERDPKGALTRYAVRYVARPAGKGMPPALGSGWRKVRGGATWDLFEVDPARGTDP